MDVDFGIQCLLRQFNGVHAPGTILQSSAYSAIWLETVLGLLHILEYSRLDKMTYSVTTGISVAFSDSSEIAYDFPASFDQRAFK